MSPPAASAPRWASPSIPRASPLTIDKPGRGAARRQARGRPGLRTPSSCAPRRRRPQAATGSPPGLRGGGGAPADRGAPRAAAGTRARLARPTSTSRRELRWRPVGESFGDVLRLDRVGAGERRYGRRDADHARPATRGERQGVDRPGDQLPRLPPEPRAPLPAAAPPPARPAPGLRRRALARRRRAHGLCGRGMWTTTSKRSSSARESFIPYAASFCGEQLHSTAGSPRAPQGHRFIVPTSTNRAGKTAWPATRAMATIPSGRASRRWRAQHSGTARRCSLPQHRPPGGSAPPRAAGSRPGSAGAWSCLRHLAPSPAAPLRRSTAKDRPANRMRPPRLAHSFSAINCISAALQR